MTYFLGKLTISGPYDEDLQYMLELFETVAGMCGGNELKKLPPMPFILKGDSLNLFLKSKYMALLTKML